MSQDHLLSQLLPIEPSSLSGPFASPAPEARAPMVLAAGERRLGGLARRLGRRGVTLVEVLIVVVIMVLISAGVSFFVLPR